MKTFEKTAAQGDVFFTKIDILPEGTVFVRPEGNRVIVAHSETQHDHCFLLDGSPEPAVKMYRLPEEIYECFIKVSSPSILKHQRSFDTHEPIEFAPGTYRIRRQREYTPEGFKRVED